MGYSGVVRALGALSFLAVQMTAVASFAGSAFDKPWSRDDRAIVLDGYEHNIFDLQEIISDEKVAAFIHKASDGAPAAYRCAGEKTERELCRKTWQRYAVSKELYQTRRALAKSLGLKWGAYHLGRPGDPIAQAQHFLDYADPKPDDLLAIDIEGLDTEEWMSLEDAQIFAQYVYDQIGRYPVLYANENVADYIADNRRRFRLLSRLPLWYARYKSDITEAFPKGNWDSYQIWQFAYQGNCPEDNDCPYRVAGTNLDIDVNVVDMTPEQLRAAWPFGKLLEDKAPIEVPLPVARPRLPGEHDFIGPTQWTFNADGTKEALERHGKPEMPSAMKREEPAKPAAPKRNIPPLLAFADEPQIDMTLTSSYRQQKAQPQVAAPAAPKAPKIEVHKQFSVEDLPPPNPARFF